MNTRGSKRILSVTITREIDTDADFSCLGEYSDTAEDYAIVAVGEHKGEFADSLPCGCGHDENKHNDDGCVECLTPSGETCDYFDRIAVERGREYRYFNSSSIESGNTDEDNRKNALQDFERMDSYERQNWCFLGIKADAKIAIPDGGMTSKGETSIVQSIRSGGLWGIESDSDDSYLTEVENEELTQLKDQLHAIGFSKRAITAAFRNVERKDN